MNCGQKNDCGDVCGETYACGGCRSANQEKALMDHMLDVYKALGVRWGDEPFAVIAHLKESGEMWIDAHNESVELKKAADKLLKALKAQMQMRGKGGVHQKLEEALAWKQNDELADRLANEAISDYSLLNP